MSAVLKPAVFDVSSATSASLAQLGAPTAFITTVSASSGCPAASAATRASYTCVSTLIRALRGDTLLDALSCLRPCALSNSQPVVTLMFTLDISIEDASYCLPVNVLFKASRTKRGISSDRASTAITTPATSFALAKLLIRATSDTSM